MDQKRSHKINKICCNFQKMCYYIDIRYIEALYIAKLYKREVNEMKSNHLTESTFYILLALASEPLHGYGIIKKVELLSENTIILAAGTLYGALENLKKSHLVDQMLIQDNSRRKVYQITDTGLEVLSHDYLRMKKLCLIAESILKKGGE